MNKRTIHVRILIMTCALLAFAALASAQTQSVAGTPTPQTAAASAAFSVDGMYSSSTTTTTGLGVRFCWDSTKATFVSATNVLATDKIAQDVAPVVDPALAGGADADTSTDLCFGIAWASFGGAWPGDAPGFVSFPFRLFTANFTAAAGFNAGSTHVNFPTTGAAAGFTYSFTPAVINAVVPVAVASVTNATMQAGANTNMTVTLNQNAPAGGTTVNLTSGTPAVATLPSATVLVAAGTISAPFVVHGVSVGVSTISASVGATPAQTGTATVIAAGPITLNCPANVSVGGSVQCLIQVLPGQITNVAITDGPNTTAAPLTVTTNASGAGSFTLTGNTVVAAPGDTITATLPLGLGSAFATDTVAVLSVTLTLTPATTATDVVGRPITYTACFSAAQPATMLVLAGAGFVFSPASPTIAAGVICPAGATFTATPTGVSAAPVTFTVSGGGLTATGTINAVTALTCTLADVGNGVLLTVSQAQPGALTIGVVSGTPAVLTVPATYILPAGVTSVTIPYTVIAAGTSTVTTTLPAAVGLGACSVDAVVNPVPVPAVGGLGLAALAALLALAGAFLLRKK